MLLIFWIIKIIKLLKIPRFQNCIMLKFDFIELWNIFILKRKDGKTIQKRSLENDHFGIVFVSFLDCFWIVFGSFLDQNWINFGSFYPYLLSGSKNDPKTNQHINLLKELVTNCNFKPFFFETWRCKPNSLCNSLNINYN